MDKATGDGPIRGVLCQGGSPAVSEPSKGKAVDFESLGG